MSGVVFFFSRRRRHTRYWRDWSSDVCSSDLDTRTRVRIPGLLTDRAGISKAEKTRQFAAVAHFPPCALHGMRSAPVPRSEERRVGKECRSRWSPASERRKKDISTVDV